jgi:carboxymethylenebutenolidase
MEVLQRRGRKYSEARIWRLRFVTYIHGTMNTKSNVVTLDVTGSPMSAYVSRPDDDTARPGIIVFQEALGVNSQIRGVADRYAELGFVALAPDLFHRVKPGYESNVLNMDELMPLIRAMTTEGFAADARACYEWMIDEGGVARDKVAAVGYCMGGRATFIANSEVPLAAAISYYAGGVAPALLDRAANIHGPHLFFWAGSDKGISPEQHRAVADALRSAGKKFVDVEFSEPNHGFFNEQIEGRYDESAAKQSWAMGTAFLADVFGMDL